MIEVAGSQPAREEGIHPAPYHLGGNRTSRLVATAIHAGHDVRTEVGEVLAVDESDRLREEDPFTDRLAGCADFRAVVSRSRFEIDLNRPRAESVYLTPEHAWGMRVWRTTPSPGLIGRSFEIYDGFYADLAAHLDTLAAAGPFVVFDIHAYNHRRDGPGADAAPQRDNPDVNVGTGSMPGKWRSLVERFMTDLRGADVLGQTLDVRENVRFRGANLARWIHERYPATGCALALEFKKTFMDEWTGAVDEGHLEALRSALQAVVPPVLDALEQAA